MLSWLLYGIVVGSLLAVGAQCLERVCHLIGRPARWIWAGALLLTGVLIGVAPYRADWLSSRRPAARLERPTGPNESAAFGGIARSFEVVREGVARPIERTLAVPEQHWAVSLDRFLVIAWMVLSAAALLVFAGVYLHVRRVRRRWPIGELHGVRVRIAPEGSPAVIGLVHPDIVIPQWLLERRVDEQRAVLIHEQEHIRAGDPWLLALACVIIAALVWHPAIWWMASRLQLAMELDCDARALRHGRLWVVAHRSGRTVLGGSIEKRTRLR